MSDTGNINASLASAFEDASVAPRKERSGHTFAIVMLAVFFVLLMGCLMAGVSIYRGVADVHAQANELHMESGLLTNIVRMNDTADTVAVADGPEGSALVLVERLESGTYETRVYLHEGEIVQEYAIAGRDFNPENALKIADSDVFEFSYDNGLLTIMTDDGVFNAALRSGQGASLGSSGATAIAGALGAQSATDVEGAGA